MIIALKHIDIEGPGTAGEFFEQRGFEIKTVALYSGEKLPASLDGIEAVLVLGGPMNVYEEAKHPFLIEENRFIQNALQADVPYLGFCLGSQLLAKAAGSKVGLSPEKEVGFYKVRLTDNGRRDPLFDGLDDEFDVFQWHEDMVEPGSGLQLLARSPGCPCQAIRVGQNAYGLQFHVEITGEDVAAWADEYFTAGDDFSVAKKKQMLDDYLLKKDRFAQISDIIYSNFLKLINKS